MDPLDAFLPAPNQAPDPLDVLLEAASAPRDAPRGEPWESHRPVAPAEAAAVPGMGTVERFARGLVGGVEDLGLGGAQIATSFGPEALQSEVQRDAMDAAARKEALYDTTAGMLGQVAPAFVFPGATIPRMIAGSALYGGLQPQEDPGLASHAKEAALGAAGATVGAGLMRGATNVVGRVVSPVRGSRPVTPRQRQVGKAAESAEALGFQTSAAQRTGSKGAELTESVIEKTPILGRKQADIRARNTGRANEILSEQMGERSAALTDDVLDNARKRIGGEFERLSSEAKNIPYDKRFLVEGRKLQRDMEALPEEFRDPAIGKVVTALFEKPLAAMRAGERPTLSAKEYQATRSWLSDRSKAFSRAGEDSAARQVGVLTGALDDMMERGFGPAAKKDWQVARRQWQGLKIAEDSVDETGNIVYTKFKGALKKHRPKTGYGPDIYKELKGAMDVVRDKAPDSFTAQRTKAGDWLGLGVGGGIGTALGALTPATLAGFAVPFAIREGLTNRSLLGYTTNELAGRVLGSASGKAVTHAAERAAAIAGALNAEEVHDEW